MRTVILLILASSTAFAQVPQNVLDKVTIPTELELEVTMKKAWELNEEVHKIAAKAKVIEGAKSEWQRIGRDHHYIFASEGQKTRKLQALEKEVCELKAKIWTGELFQKKLLKEMQEGDFGYPEAVRGNDRYNCVFSVVKVFDDISFYGSFENKIYLLKGIATDHLSEGKAARESLDRISDIVLIEKDADFQVTRNRRIKVKVVRKLTDDERHSIENFARKVFAKTRSRTWKTAKGELVGHLSRITDGIIYISTAKTDVFLRPEDLVEDDLNYAIKWLGFEPAK